VRSHKPYVSAACGLAFVAVGYLLAFPPLCAWIERRGIHSDWLAKLEPNYQAITTSLPWLSDYYSFCLVYTRTSEPPDVGLETPLWPNHPAAGNAGSAPGLTGGHHCPGVPEPGR
jgi:hypothetical protein